MTDGGVRPRVSKTLDDETYDSIHQTLNRNISCSVGLIISTTRQFKAFRKGLFRARCKCNYFSANSHATCGPYPVFTYPQQT